MDDITILFLNAGRRVELIRAFRAAFDTVGVKGRVITTDIQDLAPALLEGDVTYLLPKSRQPDFIEKLSEICTREKVNLIVPLIDPDLAVMAANRAVFENLGTKVLVSPVETIAICRDKRKTLAFLAENGFPVPKILSLDEARGAALPLFIKPADGSSSVNAYKIETREHLEFFSNYVPNAVIQEFIEGTEYTVDVFGNFDGQPLIAVPRRRLEVRSGEVSVGRIEREAGIERLALDIARKLNIVGPANIQIICGAGGDKVIEINPRFGGGAPLSIEAGAPFPAWALLMAMGRKPTQISAHLRNGVTMMRYDQSRFV